MKLDKSDQSEIRHLFIRTKDVDSANPNLIHATVSTDEVDRYEEIVLPDAFKASLGSFIDNPVVLASHQHKFATGDPPVIGNVVTESIKFKDRSVDMAILFDDDELSLKWARKYRKKVMRAFSIGFRGLEGEWKDIEGGKVWIWTKIELLEVSAVAVPANRGALLIAAGFYEGGHSDADMASVKELLSEHSSLIEKTVLDLKSFVEKRIEDIFSLLITDPDGLAEHLLGDDPDPPAPAGDKLAEQCDRIQNAFVEKS